MFLWQWLAALASRLAATIRHRHLDRDLDDELAFHLAMKQKRLAADGVSAEEAARQAERRLGNITRLKEELREVWTFPSTGKHRPGSGLRRYAVFAGNAASPRQSSLCSPALLA